VDQERDAAALELVEAVDPEQAQVEDVDDVGPELLELSARKLAAALRVSTSRRARRSGSREWSIGCATTGHAGELVAPRGRRRARLAPRRIAPRRRARRRRPRGRPAPAQGRTAPSPR
jgi:hypothetical protein